MNPLHRLYPEVAAGGYSREDGGVHFYGRVNALLQPDAVVVDFGAGRGRALIDDPVAYRRNLRDLRARCGKLIGLDPDPAVMGNPGLDEAHVIELGKPLPLPDRSVDMIVSDYTFEHIDDAAFVAAELGRILKPGGWVCARTPNRWGYIGILTTLVPNRWHVKILSKAQPDRKAIDVFPTTYPLNTRRALARHFPPERFRHCVYGHFGEARYFGRSTLLWRLVTFGARLTPEFMAPIWFVFIQKQA
jgi:SAM-dependent methyltransferase